METSKPTTTPAQYLTQKEYEALPESASVTEIRVTDWDEVMLKLSIPETKLTIPNNKEFTRKNVVQAFSTAFELIGGIPRLALWAHDNTTDFYKLYSRLLPSQASSALGESNELIIKHVLPRGPLDE